jgi:hypothetical protein
MGRTLKHREKHPGLDVDGCFACRVAGVSFAAAAMPNRRAEADRINRTESQWDRDMASYKRLRKDGLQPQKIDGARDLETKATDRVQVETGML